MNETKSGKNSNTSNKVTETVVFSYLWSFKVETYFAKNESMILGIIIYIL